MVSHLRNLLCCGSGINPALRHRIFSVRTLAQPEEALPVFGDDIER